MSQESFNSSRRKLWIFAGESSGDLYGAHLANALKSLRPEQPIAGMGGKEMAAAGVEILVDSTELGVMGFVEVIKLYPTFKRIFNGLVQRAADERPAAVVLIDYPGFNLRFAAKMKELGIPVVYYISPQIWAWKKGRAPKIARIVDHMMVIFPFEKDLYKDYNLPTTFIGHPLVEILERGKEEDRDKDLVLLLPGSRGTEISQIFPTLYRSAQELKAKHPNLTFALLTPRDTIRNRIEDMAAELGQTGTPLDIEIHTGKNDELIRRAGVAIAASGTVTVQCAILGLPLVSVYRMNPITHFIIKRLSMVDHFTMVNIILERTVIDEFAQNEMTTENIVPAVEAILPGGPRRADVLEGMAEAISRLGAAQAASRNAAEIVLKTAKLMD